MPDRELRAKLDWMEHTSRTHNWEEPTFAALRAVLNLCDEAATDLASPLLRGPTPERLIELIRSAIADGLRGADA